MDISPANFLTQAEFHRGPDLLRPGTLTGKNVDPRAIAFIYTLHPYDGNEQDIQVSPEDRHLISWPAAMGHEQVAHRESVLQALFEPDFREATKIAVYEQEIYEKDDQGNFVVVGTRLAYDSTELRRLAIEKNLFGRYGRVRSVACLMQWNRCENWEMMLDKLLSLLDVPDDGLVTQGSMDQWWARDWKGRGGTP